MEVVLCDHKTRSAAQAFRRPRASSVGEKLVPDQAQRKRLRQGSLSQVPSKNLDCTFAGLVLSQDQLRVSEPARLG